MIRELDENGISMIARFEGFKDRIYKDSAGLPTIGYGHLLKKGEDFKYRAGISEPDARQLLRKDVEIAEKAVNSLCRVSLGRNQYNALVSFVFNVGGGAFERSTLLKRLNEGAFDKAAKEFLRWNRAGGRVVKGLTKRRMVESSLFSKPV
jgi:lysozyme